MTSPRDPRSGPGQGPWLGQGVDPWLPDRLARLEQVVEAERHVYLDYWGRLSSWLVSVGRVVLNGVRPDATAVWSRAPQWAQDIADFTRTSLLEVYGIAFRTIFGEGYLFDSRPATNAYLTQVANRMVRTPEFVFDLIAAEISDGAGHGESIPQLAERVEHVLDTTGTDRWRNRATVVARTETLGALNAGRQDSFTAVADVLGEQEDEFERIWLATADTRTRPSHQEADGQRAPLRGTFTVGGWQLHRPGDPTGPAGEIIQCRCTTLLVRKGEDVDLSGRQMVDW